MFITTHHINCPDTEQPCGGCIDEARFADFSIEMSERGITEQRVIEQMWEDLGITLCLSCREELDENTTGYCSQSCEWLDEI